MNRKILICTTVVALASCGVLGFSQSRSGDLLFVPGTMGVDSSGNVAGGDIQAQTRKALENIGTTLKTGGMDYKDVVAVEVHLSDIRNFDGMDKIYREFFQRYPIVRATTEADLMLPQALVEISVIAAAPHLPRRIINPPGWSRNPLSDSRAIQAGDYLFLAGLVAQDPKKGGAVAGDAKLQTRQILDNAKALVETAGFRMSDLTFSRVWLADPRDFQVMNEVYRTYFTDVPPTRATLRARLISPASRVEIMLWGMKGDKQRLGTVVQTPLSQAILAGEHLFVSGIIPSNAAHRGDIKAQTRDVLQEIAGLLKQGGMDLSDVADAQVFLTDARNFNQMNDVYKEFLKSPRTRTTISVGLMSADMLVEIAVLAAKRNR